MTLRGRLAFESGALFAAQSASLQIVLGYGAQKEFTNAHASQQTTASSQNSDAEPTPPPVNWLGQNAQVSFADNDASDGTDASGEPIRTYAGGVSGVLREDKSDRNDAAFMSLTAAKKMLRENYEEAQSLGLSPDSYAQAHVFAKDVGSVKAVEDAITGMGYQVQSDVADLNGLLQAQSLQRSLLTVIEAFSAAIAFLLVLCILLAGGRGARAAREDSRTRRRALPGYAALGLLGGLAAVGLSGFFVLIVNTSSVDTVVFGLNFGQKNNLAISFGMALGITGISIATALFIGWISQFLISIGKE
jgi:cell division protein FtsX